MNLCDALQMVTFWGGVSRDGAIRAVPPPDEMADIAAELIDLMTAAPDTDDDAEDLDQRAFAALSALGVSGPCVEGVPG